LFCFFFVFFILYIFLNPNGILPYLYYLNIFCIQPFTNLIAWLAKDILHIVNPSVKFYNGTIDTIFGYLTVLFIFLAAIFGSFIWLVIDRRRPHYRFLYKVLIIVLRYYLAVTWIAYGSMKIIKIQFLSLSPDILLQTYGNSTPKELAWSFMGYSTGYNYFIGLAEYAAGLLLFFRRTTALGNMFGLIILANVLAFDYSFEVNVKLLTTVLMVMSLFLLSKDITRFINFFFLNKTVYPADDPPFRFKKKWNNVMLLIIKYAFIFYIIFFDLRGDIARTKRGAFSTIKQPLYGIYNVTTFIRNRDSIKPLTTDTARWNKLIISSPPGNASVMLMNNSFQHFAFQPDTTKKQILMYAKADTSNRYTFTYFQLKDSVLILRGKWHKDSLEIKFKQIDFNTFPIMNRHFHWLSDRNLNNKK